MSDYRVLTYKNSAGEEIDFSIPYKQFLYNIEGMGFEYENNIEESNFSDHVFLTNSKLMMPKFSGELTILSAFGENATIYSIQREIARILNYDQLMIRQGIDVTGMLIYKNASSVEVYSRALIKTFDFGEIEEDGDELKIKVTFDRLSKTWISTTPKVVKINLEGSDQSHKHPFKHPYTHGKVYKAGSGSITNVGGNHFAKLIISIHGEVSAFTLTIKNQITKQEKKIKYDGNIAVGETLTINNFDMYVRKNGVNAIALFDLFAADQPFFDLMPSMPYEISFDSLNLRGLIEVSIYETWVSA